VTTLSAAQLERKRANDREAQRAIRQRTKDHIEHLEKAVSELRGSHESSEKIVAVTRQRNRELEEENAFLRSRLSDVGYGGDLRSAEGTQQQYFTMETY
jgi:predicted Ser/Thr protein kinase